MAPEEGRNVRNQLLTITLAVIFMIRLHLFQIFKNLLCITVSRILLSAGSTDIGG